jgi:uncharacterized protein (TIGR00369 family)
VRNGRNSGAASVKTPPNVCFGCGPANRKGLHLKFAVETDRETAAAVVRGTMRMPAHYQGSRKVLHGGMVALLLDEAMGKFNKLDEVVAPTAELSVRYVRPVPVAERIVVEARRLRQEGRNYWREATIQDERGTLLARGEGRFVKIADRVAPK